MSLELKTFLAFRIIEKNLEPIKRPDLINPDDLLFIDDQKEKLIKNTHCFVKGYMANDVLLWGRRGSGKSALVKSMLFRFKDEGLRMIQAYKSNLEDLAFIYEYIYDKPYRFILFFDDLVFSEKDERFSLMKALLEGDIEQRPDNLIVYATSNKRDLTIEKLQDEKFPEDSLNDAYALVDRFGLRLGFWGFSKEQYINIVKHYVKSLNLTWNEEFEKEADRFALNAGGYSGRSAKQFVKYLTVNLCYNKNHG
jgi:Predicted ATPase (AAA+ superfamily)